MIHRDEIRRRLYRAAELHPSDEVMTLRWKPLTEHNFWDKLADEVERILEESQQ